MADSSPSVGFAADKVAAAAAWSGIAGTVPGASASGFGNPGAAPTADNVRIVGPTGSGTIRNNLIGFSDGNGIGGKNGADGWTIEGNEIRANGLAKAASKMYFQLFPELWFDLGGRLLDYEIRAAPLNLETESQERVEFNVIAEQQTLDEPFEIRDGVGLGEKMRAMLISSLAFLALYGAVFTGFAAAAATCWQKPKRPPASSQLIAFPPGRASPPALPGLPAPPCS